MLIVANGEESAVAEGHGPLRDEGIAASQQLEPVGNCLHMILVEVSKS